jgi:hypothetical protein
MSIHPGEISLPAASYVGMSPAGRSVPISAMRPSRMSTSARRVSPEVGSRSVPPVRRRSGVAGMAAAGDRWASPEVRTASGVMGPRPAGAGPACDYLQ